MKQYIEINGRKIGRNEKPYIIAEISANHNGDLNAAIKLIDTAVACGADAIKIQTYTPDTMTIQSEKKDFQITEGLWEGYSLYDLYGLAQTPWEWHEELFKHAREQGITLFSTPFDISAVDFLNELNTPAFKIASFEVIDLPLIEYIASKGKPMIISTGMADQDEIQEAVDTAISAGCNDIALLHCVSAYPAPASDCNLNTLCDLENKFKMPVGLSDHTIDNVSAISAVALGACIIEKHFTLDRNGGGPDDSFSLEPADLRDLCVSTDIAWQSLGKVDYGLKSSERSNTVFRRSIYAVKDIKKGEKFTDENVRSIRPGYGLAPKYMNKVIGETACRDLERGTPIKWEDLA